jgi:hypothetical protein
MRLVTHVFLALAFRRFWRRHMGDQYAILVTDLGLTRDEERALLALRRAR